MLWYDNDARCLVEADLEVNDAVTQPPKPEPRTLSLDALVVCAFAWCSAFWMISNPFGPNPYRDLMRAEVAARVPSWVPVPQAGSLIDDPITRALVAVATGLALVYAALDLALGAGAMRRRLKLAALCGIIGALVLAPSALEIGLSEWHGKPWHGHDGGVLQTDQATDLLLAGTNPYGVDYHDTPQGEQSARSAFWKRLGGNPALYHLPYLPGCFILPIPLRPVARAIFGIYDPRMLYLIAYVASLACASALAGRQRAAVVASVALCPLLVPFLVEGRNEALALAPMMAMAVCLQRGKRELGMFWWGLACGIKQFAWVYAPLVLCYLLAPPPAGRADLLRRLRPLIWAGLPVAALLGPFLLWDFNGFWNDTVRFMAGESEHPYPFGGTPGMGFANLLLAAGAVPSLVEPYNLGLWQILLGGPILVGVGWSLWKRPSWKTLIGGGTLFCAVFLYAARVLHPNYLGLLFPLLVIAAAGEEASTERIQAHDETVS